MGMILVRAETLQSFESCFT